MSKNLGKVDYNHRFGKAYDFLNAEQKQVVDTIEGAVMVVAGPGAGKTQVMSLRAANILKKTDVLADSVLCLTFTDSATQNLQKRLHRFIGNTAYDVSVFTFHSFASHLRSEFAEFFYEDREVRVVDDLEQVLLVESILEGLPLEADLRKQIPGEGYLYMGDVRQKLSQLKRGAYSASEFEESVLESEKDIEEMQRIVGPFLDDLGRMSKKKIAELVLFFEQLVAEKQDQVKSESLVNKVSWAEVFVEAFGEMILEVREQESTKPFSSWKKEWITKDDNKNSVLKDYLRLGKNKELVQVYKEYERLMDERGLVDFDDLLMDVREKLKSDDVFRALVQEKYLYVMVDEFQDTSGIQMDIVSLVLGEQEDPNIMVVGDDDQSIYKFQGAKVSNILKFKKKYPTSQLIVLDKNYRSTQDILDVIRAFVVQGEDRLENYVDELSKELTAGNSSLGEGSIKYKEFSYEIEELQWVAGELSRMAGEGVDMSEVAVIARGHASLRELSKFLREKGVAFSYEHSKNILESEVIEKVYKILLYLDAEFDRDKFGVDDLLVEILSFEFWNIPRLELWKYVHAAYKSRKDLIELIDEQELVSENLKVVIEFLVTLGQMANEKSIFEVFEYLIAGKKIELDLGGVYVCPIKEFYFPSQDGAENEESYLNFLMDLKTLFDRLKDYKVGEVLRVHEVVEYMSSHLDHGLRINNNFNVVSGKNALNLMTAHKSKGMEFETVFVLSCNSRAWESKGRVDKLKTLQNIVVQSTPDELDDFLRLFYVALSRAKENLYMSTYLMKSDGKEVKPFRFMESVLETDLIEDIEKISGDVDLSSKSVEIDLGLLLGVENAENFELDNEEEKGFLKSLVVDYKLSVTAFNNFLDLSKGGPRYFIEKNLLRFPQAKSVAAEYGTAMHYGISQYMIASKKAGKLVSLDVMKEQFEMKPRRARLTGKEVSEYLEKGFKYLDEVYRDLFVSGKFGLADLSEVSFYNENVMVGEACLNGAMDWVSFDVAEDGKTIQSMKVVDFKTGSALKSWDKNYDEFKKFKAWKYRNQLAFYYLLMSGHRKLNRVDISECGLYFLEADPEWRYLGLQVGEQELNSLRDLVEIVYKRIVNLDFPDVSRYTADFMGTMEFVDDLREGRV